MRRDGRECVLPTPRRDDRLYEQRSKSRARSGRPTAPPAAPRSRPDAPPRPREQRRRGRRGGTAAHAAHTEWTAQAEAVPFIATVSEDRGDHGTPSAADLGLCAAIIGCCADARHPAAQRASRRLVPAAQGAHADRVVQPVPRFVTQPYLVDRVGLPTQPQAHPPQPHSHPHPHPHHSGYQPNPPRPHDAAAPVRSPDLVAARLRRPTRRLRPVAAGRVGVRRSGHR